MTGTAEHGIEVQNVSKTYHPLSLGMILGRPPTSKGYVAVDDVSFKVGKGEIFGLVGPNGAGKTTLIKMICSLLHPTTGTVSIEGLDTVTDGQQVKQAVGLITSNERSFYWRLSGQQNLEFFASIYRLDKTEARKWIDQLLEFLGLERYRHERFDGFSTGTKQRFAIARGMLAKPKFLLLDEPTKGVDPINAAEIITLLREELPRIWSPTMIITSHNLREVELLCREVAIMHQSRILAQGTIDDLATSAKLKNQQRITYTGGKGTPLPTLPGTEEVTVASLSGELNEINFFAAQNSGAIEGMLRHLLDDGASVQSVDRHRQTLDDVFANLVAQASKVS